MAQPELIRNFNADGAVGQHLIVKPGTAAGQVKVGAAATDKLIGISTFVSADDGESCDAILTGIADVICGGPVGAGDFLTSDTDGKAVVLPAGLARTVAVALADGVAGDLIPARLRRTIART